MSSPDYEALTKLITLVNEKNRQIGFFDPTLRELAHYWNHINHEMTWKSPLADNMATAVEGEIRNVSNVFATLPDTLEAARARLKE